MLTLSRIAFKSRGMQISSAALPSIINPATGAILSSMKHHGEDDINSAVDSAKSAQLVWGRLSLGERSNALLQFASKLEAETEKLAHLESVNTGKPMKQTLYSDIPFSVDNIRYFASVLRRSEGISAGEYVAGHTSFTRRDPLGVVGAICPFNYPFMMAAWKVGPALAAGNAVVLKPSPNTPLSSIRMAEIAVESGLPKGLLSIVLGGEDVGETLCTHPDIAMISFTGSTRAGKRVAELASRTVKRVSMELGGKAPFIVFSDADLEAAAQGATVAGFVNTGQDCTAATRIYVHSSVYDKFLEKFIALAKTVRVGDPLDMKTDMGPLCSDVHRQRVHGFVERAVAAGTKCVLGGQLSSGSGFFYPPTILTCASETAECVKNEIFGPVVVVNRFESDEEALHLANDTIYGLAGSVWTQNVQRALRFSAEMKCGTVWVNDHLPISSELPHGGMKQSGYGKDMSHYALEEYSNVRHVMLDMTGLARKPWHFTLFGDQ